MQALNPLCFLPALSSQPSSTASAQTGRATPRTTTLSTTASQRTAVSRYGALPTEIWTSVDPAHTTIICPAPQLNSAPITTLRQERPPTEFAPLLPRAPLTRLGLQGLSGPAGRGCREPGAQDLSFCRHRRVHIVRGGDLQRGQVCKYATRLRVLLQTRLLLRREPAGVRG